MALISLDDNSDLAYISEYAFLKHLYVIASVKKKVMDFAYAFEYKIVKTPFNLQ